jgi:hypothetical protein
LLFVLLPVFAGLPGAEELFRVTALVVLISVVFHGGGIALFMRRNGGPARAKPQTLKRELAVLPQSGADDDERITLEGVRSARARGDEVIILDARADKSFRSDPRTAEGALRVEPDDPVRDATELQLSKTATLVVYCA